MTHSVRHHHRVDSPVAFSQMRPWAFAVHGLALRPDTCGSSRYAQKPESLGSPGSQRRLLLVKGVMSSQPQYDTLIFLRPTQGDSRCGDTVKASATKKKRSDETSVRIKQKKRKKTCEYFLSFCFSHAVKT